MPPLYFSPRRGWSDIDLLAYHPEEKVLVLSESKVRGPKGDVYAYTEHSRRKYGNIFQYNEDNYIVFLRNIEPICLEKIVFRNVTGMVTTLMIQLVSNYYVDKNVLPKVKKDILARIENSIPKGIKVEVRLDTTLEIIGEIIELEKSSPQGRRYIACAVVKYGMPGNTKRKTAISLKGILMAGRG